MDATTALLLSIIPASLVILTGIIIRHAGREATAFRRLVMVLEIITLSLLTLLTIVQFLPITTPHSLFWIIYLFIPVIFGMVILILFFLPQIRNVSKRDWVIVILLGLGIAGLLVYHLREPSAWMMVLPGGILILGVAWLMSAKPARWVWILPVIVIAMWALINNRDNANVLHLPQALQLIIQASFISVPVFGVAVMGLFVYTGLHLLASPSSSTSVTPSRIEGSLRLLTAVVLLTLTIYSTFWASIWDQTTDGLSGLFFSGLVALSAVATGMVISIRASGMNRLIGLVFAIIVALGANMGFRAGWDISFPQLTEKRSEQISRALERFHQREYRYPETLSDLVPRDLLYIQQPVMFQGETWCYQGATDAYRLAAFHHEYFGTPVSLHVYSQTGDLENQPLPCQERLSAMQEKYDWTHSRWESPAETLSTPAPASTQIGTTAISKEALVPIFSTGSRLLPGRWSPDGKWWFFRAPSADEKQVELYFIEAGSGRICEVQPALPYDAYTDGNSAAWISGSRLLYLNSSQLPAIYTPCQDSVRTFPGPDSGSVTHAQMFNPGSGSVLVQSQDAYWLFQPNTNTFQQIPGVQPVPYHAHWDRAAWDPSGSLLAIARLNSRDPKDGITLYRINGHTAQVIDSQKLDLAFAQSAPWIEWVTKDELLIQGPGKWLLIDFRTEPPRAVDVVGDLLNLDLKFPDQIYSSASLSTKNGAYHLLLWANHPRNQNLFVYHSDNGQVTVSEPKSQAIEILPDGQWQRVTRLEVPNPIADVLTLNWLDAPDAHPVQIEVKGHLPRSYPLLDVHYLQESNQLILASSNGISLVRVPGGEILNFWQVSQGSETGPSLVISHDDNLVLAIVDGVGIYRIPIEP